MLDVGMRIQCQNNMRRGKEMGWKQHELTKSRLIAWRQCPRKLWLGKHRPELAELSTSAQAVMDGGTRFGEVARTLFGSGEVLDIRNGAEHCVQKTEQLMAAGARYIFEAAFKSDDTLVLVDVLERVNRAGRHRYRAVEVKASTSVKDTYLDDCAIQSHVVESATGASVKVSVGIVNNQFVYGGDGNYQGILKEVEVDEQIASYKDEVPGWIKKAKKVLKGDEPIVAVGSHCSKPYDCAFYAHCDVAKPEPYPVTCLPNGGKLIAELIADGFTDLRKVPQARLSKPLHLRIHKAVKTKKAFLDPAAAVELSTLGWPRYYLDFESINPAVPMWAGTRPYQQLPFQWSLHVERELGGQLEHFEFLDLTGRAPMENSMQKLLSVVGSGGPVFVYSGFEKRVLNDMANMYPTFTKRLSALVTRLYDLHPLTREHYYHPAMMGSWSIKQILPTIAPELNYANLTVADGGAAQAAYMEAIDPAVDHLRRKEIETHLLDYCRQDTLAMVKLRRFLACEV